MIDFISGTLVEQLPTRLVVEAGGVGYLIVVPVTSKFEPRKGRELEGYASVQYLHVWTYLQVTETAHKLYGFATKEEREFFELLIDVQGIGPATAVKIMSGARYQDIQSLIGNGRTAELAKLPGVGKKKAELLVLTLKDKVDQTLVQSPDGKKTAVEVDSRHVQDAVLALVALGHKKSDAKELVASIMKIAPNENRVEEIVKSALRKP